MNYHWSKIPNVSINLAGNVFLSMSRRQCKENEGNRPDCRAHILQQYLKVQKLLPAAFERSNHITLLSETLRSFDKLILLFRRPTQMPEALCGHAWIVPMGLLPSAYIPAQLLLRSSLVVLFNPFTIVAASDGIDPFSVIEVPVDCGLHCLFKGVSGKPI